MLPRSPAHSAPPIPLTPPVSGPLSTDSLAAPPSASPAFSFGLPPHLPSTPSPPTLSSAQQALEASREALMKQKQARELAKSKGKGKAAVGGHDQVEAGKYHRGPSVATMPVGGIASGRPASPAVSARSAQTSGSVNRMSTIESFDPFGFAWSDSTPYDHALTYSSNPSVAARARSNGPGDDGGRFWVGPSALSSVGGQGFSQSAPSSPAAGPSAFLAPPFPQTGRLAPPGAFTNARGSRTPSPANSGSSTPQLGPTAGSWDPDMAAEAVRKAKLEKRRSLAPDRWTGDAMEQEEERERLAAELGALGVAAGENKRASIFGRSRQGSAASSSNSSINGRVPNGSNTTLAPSPLRSASTPALGCYPTCASPSFSRPVLSKAEQKSAVAARKARAKADKEAFEKLRKERIEEELRRQVELTGSIKDKEKLRKRDEAERKKALTAMTANQRGNRGGQSDAASVMSGGSAATTGKHRKSWFGTRRASMGATVVAQVTHHRSMESLANATPPAVGSFEVDREAPPTPAIPYGLASARHSPVPGVIVKPAPPLLPPPTLRAPPPTSTPPLGRGTMLPTVPASPILEPDCASNGFASQGSFSLTPSPTTDNTPSMESPEGSRDNASADKAERSSERLGVPRDSASTDECESSFPSTPDSTERELAADEAGACRPKLKERLGEQRLGNLAMREPPRKPDHSAGSTGKDSASCQARESSLPNIVPPPDSAALAAAPKNPVSPIGISVPQPNSFSGVPTESPPPITVSVSGQQDGSAPATRTREQTSRENLGAVSGLEAGILAPALTESAHSPSALTPTAASRPGAASRPHTAQSYSTVVSTAGSGASLRSSVKKSKSTFSMLFTGSGTAKRDKRRGQASIEAASATAPVPTPAGWVASKGSVSPAVSNTAALATGSLATSKKEGRKSVLGAFGSRGKRSRPWGSADDPEAPPVPTARSKSGSEPTAPSPTSSGGGAGALFGTFKGFSRQRASSTSRQGPSPSLKPVKLFKPPDDAPPSPPLPSGFTIVNGQPHRPPAPPAASPQVDKPLPTPAPSTPPSSPPVAAAAAVQQPEVARSPSARPVPSAVEGEPHSPSSASRKGVPPAALPDATSPRPRSRGAPASPRSLAPASREPSQHLKRSDSGRSVATLKSARSAKASAAAVILQSTSHNGEWGGVAVSPGLA